MRYQGHRTERPSLQPKAEEIGFEVDFASFGFGKY